MKKLLTLILPALALTTGAPMATGDAASYYHRAKAKEKLNDNAGYQADFQRAAKSQADDVASYFYRAHAKQGLGDAEGARADFQRAAESQADDVASYFYRADAKRQLDDYEGGAADAKRRRTAAAGDAASYYHRADDKVRLRDYEGARADWKRAIDAAAGDATGYYYRGLAKQRLKDYEGAKADFRRAAENKIDEGVTQVADAAPHPASPAPAQPGGLDPATRAAQDRMKQEREQEQDKARYGAVAVTAERTAYALAVGYKTQRDADQWAATLCNQARSAGESLCPGHTTINAPCAAIAKVDDGTDAPIGGGPGHIWEVGIGSDANEAGAKAAAIRACQGQHGRPSCSLHSSVCAPAERHANIRGRLDKPGGEAIRDIKGYIEHLVGEEAAVNEDPDAPEIFQ